MKYINNELLDNIYKIFSILIIIFTLAFSVYFALLDKLEIMTRMIFLGISCLFFINLKNFKRFKFGDMEADLRDTINEAQLTREELDSLLEEINKKIEAVKSEASSASSMARRSFFT